VPTLPDRAHHPRASHRRHGAPIVSRSPRSWARSNGMRSPRSTVTKPSLRDPQMPHAVSCFVTRVTRLPAGSREAIHRPAALAECVRAHEDSDDSLPSRNAITAAARPRLITLCDLASSTERLLSKGAVSSCRALASAREQERWTCRMRRSWLVHFDRLIGLVPDDSYWAKAAASVLLVLNSAFGRLFDACFATKPRTLTTVGTYIIAVGAQPTPGRSTRAPHARVLTLTPLPDRERQSTWSTDTDRWGATRPSADVALRHWHGRRTRP
jgi:hypothetical protein